MKKHNKNNYRDIYDFGGFLKQLAPMAIGVGANALLPGSGLIAAPLASAAISSIDDENMQQVPMTNPPINPALINNSQGYFKNGGNWIQKAVNPEHKGYCTPMTKDTCTPRRKALAMTFKKYHGFHADGGELDGNIFNFMGPRHENGGIHLMTPNGIAEVEGGETMNEDYIFSDRLKPKGSKKTFAELSKYIDKKYKGKEDPISIKSKQRELDGLKMGNESMRIAKENKQMSKAINTLMKYGGKLYQNGGEVDDTNMYESLSSLNSNNPWATAYRGFINPNISNALSEGIQNSFEPSYDPTKVLGDEPTSTINVPSKLSRTVSGVRNKLGNIDYSNVGNTAAAYFPAAYNLATGIFGKPNRIAAYSNPYTNQIEELSNNAIDFSPIRSDIKAQANASARDLRNSGLGRSAYLANRGQITANTQDALAKARMDEQSTNANLRAQRVSMLQGLGRENTAYKQYADELNLRARMNKASRLDKGLTQLSQIGANNLMDTRLENRDKLLYNTIPTLYPALRFYPELMNLYKPE